MRAGEGINEPAPEKKKEKKRKKKKDIIIVGREDGDGLGRLDSGTGEHGTKNQ